MTLSQQVCSLDLAKRLKKLGVEQRSLFYHHEKKLTSYKNRMFAITQNPEIPKYPNPSAVEYENVFAAFTTAELGEMLPSGYVTWWYAKQDGKATTLWRTAKSVYDDEKLAFEAVTEADARAKCLIYLKENSLI